jgi:hypothetical protein
MIQTGQRFTGECAAGLEINRWLDDQREKILFQI